MTDEELIELGNKLIAKDRSAIEIFNTLRYKSNGKQQLNRVLPKVVHPDAKKKKHSPERVKVLLKANDIKLRSDYSIKSLMRLSFVVLCLGGIVLFLSSERVNGNAFFGWTTIAQGICLCVLYYLVKYKGKTDLLLIGMASYILIWAIEIITNGIPNDLLEAYNHIDVRTSSFRQKQGTFGARLIGYSFPYLYIGVKFMLGFLTVNSYLNHRKYDNLPHDIKTELHNF